MNTIFLSAGRRAGTNALQVARADAAAWGSPLETATRTVAAVAVAVYTAGLLAGEILHATNAHLAAAYRCLLVGGHRAAEQAADALQPISDATDRYVEALLAAPATWNPMNALLTVQELRTQARKQLGSSALIGGRRIAQARRADLLAALA